MGLEGLPLAIMVSHDVAVLITGRVSDMSWNGRKFQCVATTISGGTVTKTISLWVKGHYTKILHFILDNNVYYVFRCYIFLHLRFFPYN